MQSSAAVLVEACASLITLSCILWNLDLPTRLGIAVLTEQYLSLVLGMSICIVFLNMSWRRQRDGGVNVLDLGCALLGLGTLAAFGCSLLAPRPAYHCEVPGRAPLAILANCDRGSVRQCGECKYETWS